MYISAFNFIDNSDIQNVLKYAELYYVELTETIMSAIDKSASKINTLSATVFMHNCSLSGQAVFRRLPEKWFKLFDGDPIMMPLPDGAPREIPVLILRSKNQNWSCSFTSDRIGFQWTMNEIQKELDVPSFFAQAIEFFDDIKAALNIQIGRLAAICHRYIVCDNPGIILASHFCKDRWLEAPLNRPENFELHSHKKYSIYSNLEVNSWVRAKTAFLAPTKEQVIFVEQDINTLAENIDNNVSSEDMSKFFNYAHPELDKIFGLYFPSEDTV